MPIHRCSIDGRSGWKWGESGKCYVGSRGRSKALRQARAIRASGWVENVARRHARASRIDPSRTTMLREKFRRELVGRYERVRRAVLQIVGRENLFRIVENREYVPGPKYPFTTDPERVEAFTAWLKERMDGEVLPTDDAYWERYTAEGFTRGAGRAFDDVNRLKRATAFGGNEPMAHYLGTKEQFLQSAFGQPETIDKLKILAGRVYTDLKGVNEAVSTQLNRVLVDGLARGENPRTIAREMAKGIDGIGKRRAETIARTEIIRAHAEGQLDAMERLGVDEVGVMAEWSTAGDDHVCDLCWPLEGKVLPITEAHSLIPLHPNCRCTWIPSVSTSVKKVPEKKPTIKEPVETPKPTLPAPIVSKTSNPFAPQAADVLKELNLPTSLEEAKYVLKKHPEWLTPESKKTLEDYVKAFKSKSLNPVPIPKGILPKVPLPNFDEQAYTAWVDSIATDEQARASFAIWFNQGNELYREALLSERMGAAVDWDGLAKKAYKMYGLPVSSGEELKTLYQVFNQQIALAPKSADTVYRGMVYWPDLPQSSALSNLKVGDEFVEHWHVSASRSDEVASTFSLLSPKARDSQAVSYLFEYHGASVKIDSLTDVTFTEEFKWQQEHVIQAGQRWRIKEIKTQPQKWRSAWEGARVNEGIIEVVKVILEEI
jgi:SPP1 gp7 family putative phage head morphogenesis protein